MNRLQRLLSCINHYHIPEFGNVFIRFLYELVTESWHLYVIFTIKINRMHEFKPCLLQNQVFKRSLREFDHLLVIYDFNMWSEVKCAYFPLFFIFIKHFTETAPITHKIKFFDEECWLLAVDIHQISDSAYAHDYEMIWISHHEFVNCL